MKETEFEIQATVEDLWKLEILAGAAQVSKETSLQASCINMSRGSLLHTASRYKKGHLSPQIKTAPHLRVRLF